MVQGGLAELGVSFLFAEKGVRACSERVAASGTEVARGIESAGSGRGFPIGGTGMSSANPRTALFRSLAFTEGGLLQIIRGKYKLRILWNLQHGAIRFGALRKELAKGNVSTNEIAPRVLSRELKSLVDLGLIQRRAYNVVPPKVEYRLTALGQTVLPVISMILEWGNKHSLRRSASKELGLKPRSCEVETPPRNLSTQLNRSATFADRVHMGQFALQRRNSLGSL